jgi:ABC-type polysaccharide/polyol phosphate transport system ATPase subunit
MCQSMCSKALLLSKGETVFFGDVKEAFEVYAKL